MARLQDDVLWNRAQQAYTANDMPTASRCCEQLLQRNKKNADALMMLGRIAMDQNRLEAAAAHVLQAIAIRPRDPLVQTLLAQIRIYQGRFDDAVTRCDKALRRDPKYAPAATVKADAYERSGQREKARAVMKPFIADGRVTLGQAIMQARLDLHDGNYEAVIDLANPIVKQAQGASSAVHLSVLLGQALERTHRFDEAFASYEQANAAMTAHFDSEEWQQTADDLIESYTPERFAALPRASHGSQLPVFVLGMPRSGSTLVEAILAAHPDVGAAGEFPVMQEIIGSFSLKIGSNLPYPACIEDLDQTDVDTLAETYLGQLRRTNDGAKHIVDKFLNNYIHAGMLAILFPQARIIHCQRHPLDICLSCFQTPLFPTLVPYSTDLRNLGIAFLVYERIMAHWNDALGIPMFDARYEAMVADQEGMTRRMLDFCGLEFNERCLRYYKGGAPALTASYDQVNRPIYSSSVGRYRNFEKHLGPLKEVLAEGGWTEEAFERAATAG
jgi:tetratricopeptide (TPR) repeat protein